MRNLTAKAIWILFSDGGAKLVGFFTTIYLARTFQAESYGLIVMALSVMGTCIWLSDLGLQTVATREIASTKPEERSPSRFFWLKISLSVVVLMISAIICWFLFTYNPELRTLVLLFLLSLVPQALQIQWYYQGVQDFRWITLANWIQGALYLGGLLLIVSSDDIQTVPVIYSLSILAGALVMLLSYRGKRSLLSNPQIFRWKNDIKNSLLLGSGQFMAQTIILLPPIVIGYFISEADAGYFSAAFKLVLVVMMLDKLINVLLLSNLSRLWNENPSEVTGQLSFVARWMIVFGSIGALGLFFISPFAVPFLFGPEYQPSILILKFLCFFLPITFLNSVYSYGLISFGNDQRFMRSTFLGGSISVILITASALLFDLRAVLLAIVLSELVITFCVYQQFKKTIDLGIRQFIIVSVVLLAIITFSISQLSISTLVQTILAITLFPVLLFMTGYLTREHLLWMKRRIMQ